MRPAMFAVLATAVGAATTAASDIYVDVMTGSDLNDGGSPATALKTLNKAANVAQAFTTVHVAAGDYILEQPLDIRQAGTSWAAEGGAVRVSGGVEIPFSAWTPVGSTTILQADVSRFGLNASTRHLFVNGRRSPRARLQQADLQRLFQSSSVTDYGYDLTKLPTVQCAADYGTSRPCCGQPGNDVSHQWQCPSNQPICTDYVYDQHWGHCQPKSESGSSNTQEDARSLPQGNLILAYATSCDNDGASVLAEARNGVNVIVWFATNLIIDENTQKPLIGFGLNSTCIAWVAKTLRDEGLETAHLISIGGWDAPHPNTSVSGDEWWAVWKQWNQEVVAVPSLGFKGFDGIDWDLEGNDAPTSPWNQFTQACLDLMGTMSASAKRDGFLVTLVPPESYMDASTSAYDRSLRHRYPEDWHEEFLYHGHNAYAYLLAKYPSDTWDLVDIQLYETYAHADYYINQKGVDAADYLVDWCRNVTQGWTVDFENDPNSGLDNQIVRVPPEKLIVGFSFGTGSSGKTVFIWPDDVKRAFSRMATPPRGVMFWNVNLDRLGVFNGTQRTDNYTLAAGFNAFLHVRSLGSTPLPSLPPGAEMVYPQTTSPWTEPRCAVDEANETTIMMKQPCWYNLVHKACGQNVKGPPSYVEGIPLMSNPTPGTWSLSQDAKTIFYQLLPSEKAASLNAVVPVLEVLLRVGKGADGSSFSGFTFEHATWRRPGLSDGFVEQQTGACTVGNFSQNNDCDVDFYWSVKSPGNVQVSDAANVSFKKCEFARLGGIAIDFTRAPNARVENCYFHDISGSGVQIGQFQQPLEAHLDAGAVVSNTIINKAGAEYSGAAGINVGYTQNTSLLHNDVSNLSYVPITVGWGWSRHECWNCTNAGNNTIAFNRVHDYKQTLNDGGGIYMLGPQNNSLIFENYVFDQGTASSGALYPDEGSAYSTWLRNVVADIGRSEWLHLWTSSIHNVTIQENFADTSTYENHGTNCPMIDNQIVAPGKFPQEAVQIMNASGVGPENPWHRVVGRR